MSIDLLLHIVAFICFIAAAGGVNVRWVSLGWAGLAFWVLASIL